MLIIYVISVFLFPVNARPQRGTGWWQHGSYIGGSLADKRI